MDGKIFNLTFKQDGQELIKQTISKISDPSLLIKDYSINDQNLKISSVPAQRVMVKVERLLPTIEKIIFSKGRTKNTATIPARKVRATLRLGSGCSRSSLRQNQSQSKAGSTPPSKDKSMVIKSLIILYSTRLATFLPRAYWRGWGAWTKSFR